MGEGTSAACAIDAAFVRRCAAMLRMNAEGTAAACVLWTRFWWSRVGCEATWIASEPHEQQQQRAPPGNGEGSHAAPRAPRDAAGTRRQDSCTAEPTPAAAPATVGGAAVCEEHPQLTPMDVAGACVYTAAKLYGGVRKARDVVNVCYFVEQQQQQRMQQPPGTTSSASHAGDSRRSGGEAVDALLGAGPRSEGASPAGAPTGPQELDIGEGLFERKDRLVLAEQVLLRELRFDCRVPTPFAFLFNYIRSFATGDAPRRRVARLAVALAGDAVDATFYAMHPPDVVATVVLHAAQVLLGADPSRLAVGAAGVDAAAEPTAKRRRTHAPPASDDFISDLLDEVEERVAGADPPAPAPAPRAPLVLPTPLWARVLDADLPLLQRATVALLARYGVAATASSG